MLEAASAVILYQDRLVATRSKLRSSLPTGGPILFNQGFNLFLAKPLEILSYAAILSWDIEKVKQFNIANILELIPYTFHQLEDPDKRLAVLAAVVGFRAYSGLVRHVGTRIIGEHFGADTAKTRTLSLIPYVGDFSTAVIPTLEFIRNRFWSRKNLPTFQN